MLRRLSCLAAFGLVLAFGSTSQAAIITNGSFEDGPDPGSFTTLNAVNNSIPSWTVSGGSVDYIGTYWQAAQGVRSIDMDGNSPATLYQNLNTVSGQEYLVTFAVAGNPDGPPQVKSLSATAGNGGTTVLFDVNTLPSTHSNMGWVDYSFNFTASSASTQLSFFSNDKPDNNPYGPALDNVRVNAVPEPATLAMSGIAALIVSGVALRRRKSTIAQA